MDKATADLGALARIEIELTDVDVVLACLDRTEPTRCEVCKAATADGSISSRAALRLCSYNRQPAGDDPAAGPDEDDAGDQHPTDGQLSGPAAPPTMPATELAGDGGPRGTV